MKVEEILSQGLAPGSCQGRRVWERPVCRSPYGFLDALGPVAMDSVAWAIGPGPGPQAWGQAHGLGLGPGPKPFFVDGPWLQAGTWLALGKTHLQRPWYCLKVQTHPAQVASGGR